MVLAVTAALVTAQAVAAPAPAAAAGQSCATNPPSGDFAAEVASSAPTARTWRLYQAFFLRQPDRPGLDYWLAQFRGGLSLADIASNFERSAEFASRYGAVDNAAFVTLVYGNVLCRAPDPAGDAYWLDLLERGVLSRGQVMILFSESAELGLATGTRWSTFADPASATLASDGYELAAIPGGQAVRVDYHRVDVRPGRNRCAVASINANWFTPERAADPTPIGMAVIDGQALPGSGDRDDRGVLGERLRPNGPDPERVWVYQGSFHLNSNLATKDGRVLESWASWQPASTPTLDAPAQWRWAAAGIPLVVNGQVWSGLADIPPNDYTFYSGRHSFVAFDKATGVIVFAATMTMDAAEIVDWALAGGYDDVVLFDGGSSVELNLGGQPRVGGTSRHVPLWLGVGC